MCAGVAIMHWPEMILPAEPEADSTRTWIGGCTPGFQFGTPCYINCVRAPRRCLYRIVVEASGRRSRRGEAVAPLLA